MHDLTMHVGQAEVSTAVAVGQSLVVQAHQVQDRGVEIVNVDGILGGHVAELVGVAVGEPTLHAASREPHREASAVMIATLRPL